MNNFSISPTVIDRLERLGERIRIARLRRGWSVVVLAGKAGVNRNTLTAVEQGKPGTSVVALVSALWALGLDEALEQVADPDRDLHGKTLEAARRPQRGRGAAQAGARTDYDF
jgi:transcriptional regulator with XRE-family HTH domain